MKQKKIFQIGFNKSGTTSIHQFFLDNNILSIHWDAGKLSKTIHNNFLSGNPLLKGYEDYQAFTDMEHNKDGGGFFYSAEKYFKELDQSYPGSLFILNFRDIESWIKSRINHGRYLFNTMNENNTTEEEVKEKWKDEYKNHIQNVLEYFKERDNLLVLELKKGNEYLLGDFLSKHGIPIKKPYLGYYHKTKKYQQ
jgi:predicted transposase YbfD/YdcC